MKVETTSNMRLLDEDHRPPLGSILVYANTKGDLMALNNFRSDPHYWFASGSATPWSWRDAWVSMHSGDPITLIALLMGEDTA